MKHVKIIAAAVALVLAAAMVPVVSALAAGSNLIGNPSAETVADGLPDKWTPDRWGDNAATLTVADDGHTGSKSLRVDMTAHTDGDAKWMADPAAVSPNTSYTYSTFYKSNTDTEITLQYTNGSGNLSYSFVQMGTPSAEWKELSVKFTTPADATKAVVMHLVSQPGWLQTDDVSLVKTPLDTPPPIDEENLVQNPSFETANAQGTLPAKWSKDKWGTNTAKFTYDTAGHTGRSATVKMTGYTSGDAKWAPQPVAVQAGKSYIYRDYYKSNVATRVVAAYVNAAGDFSYAELPGAAASTGWKKYEAALTVPAGTAKAAVYHLIDRVGTLSIDDTLLQAATPPPPPDTASIPNGSLETAASATMPAQWQRNAWGQNNATFAYVNEGRTGGKSVKVTMSNHTNGDAKWYFDPITTLGANKQYRFTVWYKTSVQPKAVMMYLTADGAEHFMGMPSPEPGAQSATAWQKYSDVFEVPPEAMAVSAFLFIDQNGWLQTDDYSLGDYSPTGFTRPLLTLTFDDGHEDNVTTALPLLKQYGFKTTACFATTYIEGDPAAVTRIQKYVTDGHEICSHTVTHPYLTSLGAADLTYELQHSQQYLRSITGATVDNFASPYGDYNAAVNTEIKKYYRSHRTVDEGYNTKDNLDLYRLRVQNILDTTTADQVRQWIEQAKLDKTWLILVYHRVADDPGPYDTTVAHFTQQLEAIKQSGITVKTTNDALNELLAQL